MTNNENTLIELAGLFEGAHAAFCLAAIAARSLSDTDPNYAAVKKTYEEAHSAWSKVESDIAELPAQTPLGYLVRDLERLAGVKAPPEDGKVTDLLYGFPESAKKAA